MKKLIRVLFPILLAISIVLCLIWYLFEYDREFTRDILLSGARYFESQGNRNVAATFYNLAYSHSGDNDAVAIELAEQYKASGNYTKAEYTLSHAISDGGGIELYIALCNTYVEQDKLMDAVAMLNSITDPTIRAQLDEIRPKAPEASIEPGFYSQYALVDILSDSGTLYITTNGEYPSTENIPYNTPVQLIEGENTIIALVVADNGLVSPLSTFGYIVGGVIEEVQFEDAAFAAAIRSLLGFDANEPIHTNDLWDILDFTIPAEARSYSDLKYLTYLERLVINSGDSNQLHNLSSLSHLNELHIFNCDISDEGLSKIAALPVLNTLTLQNCGISGIAPLSEAINLVNLDLSNNAIRNLQPLTSLKKLQKLNLNHNAVTDLSALSSISTLKELSISYNSLTTIAPITAITGLTKLFADTNAIADLGDLNKLTSLTHLSLAKNNITDISLIATCTGLTELNISNNAISDIASLDSLNKLRYFNFSNNQITALPEWERDCALVTIDGTSNHLSSLDVLAGMPSLNNVYMDYNEAIESIEALASCPVLIQVNVYGTKVTEVTMLTNQSIIVNYNPVQEAN